MYIKNELSPSLKETEWETFVHNFFVNLDWRVRNTLLKHQRNANDIRLAVCLFSSLFGIKDWRRMKREAAWKRFFLSLSHVYWSIFSHCFMQWEQVSRYWTNFLHQPLKHASRCSCSSFKERVWRRREKILRCFWFVLKKDCFFFFIVFKHHLLHQHDSWRGSKST